MTPSQVPHTLQLFQKMVILQIKDNEAYDKMVADSLPLHTSLTFGIGSIGLFFFSENSHVAYQINGHEAENSMQANSMPFYTLDTWMGSKF